MNVGRVRFAGCLGSSAQEDCSRSDGVFNSSPWLVSDRVIPVGLGDGASARAILCCNAVDPKN